MRNLLVKNKASIWLIFICWGLAAFMTHPSMATLVTLAFLMGLLWILRWVAHVEGSKGE